MFNFANFLLLKSLSYNSEFIIKFSGLKSGTHQYDYSIDGKFFDFFEYSEIKKGKIDVSLLLDKLNDMLTLNFSIKGTIETECDRCLEVFDLLIEGKETLFVRFGGNQSEADIDEIIISDSETQIDISKFIYEIIILLTPYRRVHPDDENGVSLCNKEVMEKLNILKSTNSPDLLWEKLNEVKLKN